MVYPARSILIVDPSPFDESLLLLPALRQLRQAYANAFVAAASATGACQLLTASGLVQSTIDLGPLRGEQRISAWRVLKASKQARRQSFDLVLDCGPHLVTQLIGRVMLGARTVSASSGPDLLASLLGGRRRRIPLERASRYQSVLRQIGLTPSGCELRVDLSREEYTRFEEMLARAGFKGSEPLLLLHSPDAGERGSWPVERFALLGSRLSNGLGARVVAADEPGSTNFSELIASMLPPAAILLAAPQALQLAASVARASVVVTTGAGVLQLASEFGAPSVDPRDRTDDELYDLVAEALQASRSESLFKR